MILPSDRNIGLFKRDVQISARSLNGILMIRYLLTVFCAFLLSNTVYSQQVFCAKIPGYTGYAIPNESGIKFDEIMGCTEWSNEDITLQYNVRIESKGDMSIRLMLSNDGPTPAFLSLKFGDKVRELKVPPTGGNTKYTIVDAGVFTADYPGFYSIWIKPVSKTGTYYPGIMNVQLCTPFADKITFPTVPERNASTVNLTYLPMANEKIQSMYVSTNVPNSYDYQGTRVSAISNEVYRVGMANEVSGRYIYMSWKNIAGYSKPNFKFSQFKNFQIDSSNEKITRLIIPYNWSPDQPLSFSLIQTKDSCTQEYNWEARIYNERKKRWHTICIVNGGNTHQLVKNWYSAIINSDPNTGNVEHKALFSNPIAISSDGRKVKLSQARFGHDLKGKTERCDYGAGIENDSFWLSTGGFSFPQATYGRIYEIKSRTDSHLDDKMFASYDLTK
jgi:hypothetical protein